ncbi:MAG: Txe/YoeB family addiction module toxin [Propionibacteriaceae bacterium]|nr:Txe/YoeB family addiction module toxin [Propionibacteriaceae bacterium]
MKVVFTAAGRQDLAHWIKADPRLAKRAARLIEDAARRPAEGIGHPEPLRGDLAGAWSRRIDAEHRLVYLVEEDHVVVLQARYHYR